MNNLVSVIVPVYNVEKYITICVESILRQTYKNLEIILVDDGSTDNSGKICDSYSSKDCRIMVIHKENGGLSDARNVGIDHAKGDYLILVDSDDYINSKMIEIMLSNAIRFESDIVACEYKKVKDDNGAEEIKKNVETLRYSNKQTLVKLYSGELSEISFIAVCKLYKREMFGDIEFPVGRYYEDTFTTHKLINKAKDVVIVREGLYYYRVREGSIIQSSLNEKKIVDGLDADAESMKTFLHVDSELMSLAYKNFCHAQFKRYREIEGTDISKNEKKKLQQILVDRFKVEYKRYSKIANLPIKYKIANFIYIIVPGIFAF